MKTVAFKIPKPSSPVEWVRGANVHEETPQPVEPKAGLDKRFSMLMPGELHSRVKMECAQGGG